jgi:hypothetical protein
MCFDPHVRHSFPGKAVVDGVSASNVPRDYRRKIKILGADQQEHLPRLPMEMHIAGIPAERVHVEETADVEVHASPVASRDCHLLLGNVELRSLFGSHHVPSGL